jgi:hypothetical protein
MELKVLKVIEVTSTEKSPKSIPMQGHSVLGNMVVKRYYDMKGNFLFERNVTLEALDTIWDHELACIREPNCTQFNRIYEKLAKRV